MNVDVAPKGLKPEFKGLFALLDYWRRIGDGTMPSRADFDPADIPELLGHLLLIDVERTPVRFRARLCGTTIDRTFGRYYTGSYLDDLNSGYFERDILSDYTQVVLNKQPHFACRDVFGDAGRWIRYQRLLLPLSADGWVVDMLLGGVYAAVVDEKGRTEPVSQVRSF